MISKFKIIKLSLLIFIIISLMLTCNKESNSKTVKNEYNNKIKMFIETTRFISGKSIDKNSKLYKFTNKKYYTNYKTQIQKGWNKFQSGNLKVLKKWWENHSPKEYKKNIMYPFSGPDIMNAVTLFPKGKIYIMFGLEKPGIIPSPLNMTNKELIAGLDGVKRSLSTIFKYNFFRTKGMKVKLSNKSFNGIAGLIIFFLGLNDYEVIDVKKIAIDANSKISQGIKSDEKINWEFPPKSKRIPGVEISFREKGGETKIIRYYMLNVIDNALKKYSPNFIPYLKSEGKFTTVIKSASYLMHNDKIKFTKIRKAIITSTDYFIQDDSGVPLRYFGSKKWNVKFHGFYDKPISLFYNRYQNDLKIAMKKKSTGKLPFSYGYNFAIGQSNLMTAERIKNK
jgi:hypothetical protein